MAKQKTNHIALETDAFEKKVNEFQTYLANRDINQMEHRVEDISKEIADQLKIMAQIPVMLEQLRKLREIQEKEIEARGGVEIGGLAERFIKGN